MLKLAVIGSRTFSNPKLLGETLSKIAPSVVISGGAIGADKLGERWARKNGIETEIYLPNHKAYKHPYHHRNRLIVEACDELIAFWDTKSSGTRYTIGYARKMGKPVTIVKF